MRSTFRRLLGATLLTGAFLSPQLHADDIDLYTGGEASTGSQANVLIVIDNSSAWNSNAQGWPDGKQGYEEYQALAEIVQTLGDNVNIGIGMLSGEEAGYVRFGVREMNNTNKSVLVNMLNTMADKFLVADERGDDQVGQNSNYDQAMNSFFRYFNGKDKFLDGKQGSDLDLRDYNCNTVSPTRQPACSNSLGSYPLSNSTATTYSPPDSAAGGCAKNFIVFIGQKYPNQTGTTTQLTDAAALIGITDATTLASITATISGGSTRLADEWARFMKTYGVSSLVDDPKSTTSPKAKLVNGITTYTLDVCKDHCDTDQATLLKSMANVGGGKYFKSTSKQEIKNAMSLIFAEIQAVNSVFASATLPISVNTQGTFENQVYIGVFRPDAGAKPRWFGNLKEYKFGRYCDADRNDKVLIDSTRALGGGMVAATMTGSATGAVTGSFTGTVTNQAGTSTAVSGSVSGTISGTASATLLATVTGYSPGTTGSPAASLGSGTVTGTVTDGTSVSSTFTGTLNATPSITGTFTAADERVGDDVPAPSCGTDATGNIPLSLYLGDKNGYRAIDEQGNTGFIDLSASSYWTSASTFWAASPNTTAGSSDSPDGPEVERGGAAQRLRTHWAETAPTGHPDGRKLYTCLGTCLAEGATASQKTLSNNIVSTSNSEVTTALAAPAGSATVSLARSGNTVTATSTAAHGFSDGASVTVAGATPTDYNGAKTITYVDATHFTYTLNESPSNTVTGTIIADKSGGTVSISSLTLSTTTAGATAVATVTNTGNNGLAVGSTTTIAGAAQSFLNTTHTVTNSAAPTATSFTFSVTIPASTNPGASSAAATIKCGGSGANETASGTWDSATGRFTFDNSASGNFSTYPAGCRNATTGATVTVTGATDSKYNGSWTVVSAGNATVTVGTLAAATATVSPDTGASKTATIPGVSKTVTIARTLGSTTATATAVAHGFSTNDSIIISGATPTNYNGTWTITRVDDDNFTFGPITLTPTTPPTGTITATAGSGVAGPDTTNLILWTRGKDLWEDEDLNSSLSNVRASIQGDVLHARPVMVNYGSTLGVVGFYGANDGFLRAIKAGIAETDGVEKWAFMPTEFMTYSKLARLYTNSETVRYPNTSCSVSPTPTARTYFWDGSLVAYQSPDGTASTAPTKTWLFATMRRGGRALYALDVTDPDAPKFMWRITNATSGFSELGQTWSEPKITKLAGSFTRADATVVTNPVVLVFGAGYDASQEDKPTGSAVTPTMGRGVYVVEAETGQLIQFLQPTSDVTTSYSFAADVNVLDLNADGYLDRIYAGDTNANIFRFDTVQSVTNVASSSYWKRYHIASVGDVEYNGGNNARKFMFAPEVLPFTHNGVVKVMVLVGSGNREKPLNNFKSDGSLNALTCSALYTDTYFSTSSLNKVNDRFFGLLDTIQSGADEAATLAAAATDPILFGDLQQINSNTLSTTTLTAYSLSGSDRGWQILLRNDPDGSGVRNEEKTVNAAKVVAGVVYFATSTPISSGTTVSVSSITRSSTTATVTTATTHPFLTGDRVTVSGATQTGYNGTFTITKVSSTSFTYSVANTVVTPATGTILANGNSNTGVCSNLGEALGYAVDPFTGLPAINRDASTSGGTATYTSLDYATKFTGGGLPPTVTAGVVSIGGTPYRFIIGSGGTTLTSDSPIAGTRSVLNLTGTRTRLYWSYGAD